LVFAAPWESRVFGLVASYLERTGQPWEAFRHQLIAAVAAAPENTSYYESFTAAFEALLVIDGVLSTESADPLR
jgi:Nitrile hydratase beta subunit